MEYTGERFIVGGQACDKESDIYREHMGRYRFAVEMMDKNDRVLDIACGSGYGSKMLSDKAHEVWAGDIDEGAVREARKKYDKENLHFKVMDVVAMPFEDNYFDSIVSFETIEHIEKYINFIQEIKRVLKPGGRLIISTPDGQMTKKLGIANPFHIKEFSRQEMLDLLEGNFKDIEEYAQRGMAKMSISQKLLQKLYFIYRRLPLGFLSKLVSDKSKEQVGESIKGLSDEFGVVKRTAGKDYLYLIYAVRK